ncbi:MAG: helix-turn-helix transcriptional regulator [Clostridiales bacterium]|nr:PadR family transcriptional regulator [Clostridiales bacterium]MDD7347500.1 helix-turn-helix transcriptional regulator [Clostridiales bacterium]MDY4061246.1 helix-turn-helix transcriptional regulator [Anaerovoracaceae bacterium]
MFSLSSTIIELLILSIVKRSDSYGYDISQKIKMVSDIKESTLYPILKKMNKSGYLESYLENYNGRARKYYRITQDGKEHLEEMEKEWDRFVSTINMIGGRNE